VIGLELNAEKTKYMFTSCEQNAQQIHKIKTGNKSLESLANTQRNTQRDDVTHEGNFSTTFK